MTDLIREMLMPGAYLTGIHTQKFKSSVLSVSLVAPLRKETAAVNALIPSILRRGTQVHPDMQSLSAALDELYGGSIEPVVRKRGESQCVGFVAGFLDDAYTLDGDPVLERAIALLGELLLRPRTVDGAFHPDYTGQEKENLKDRIAAEINDKRQYAVSRLVEEMCANEPYGVGRMGKPEEVDAITPRWAWERYRDLLAHSRLEIYYCGSADCGKVREMLVRALADLPREGGYQVPETVIVPSAAAPRRVEEILDVAQGKLTMGFRTGGITAASPQYPALVLCNALFGGTTTSKLFLNVREKLSLCYYASSALQKYKGTMVVSSGVEFSHGKRAEDEILAQLEACRRGQLEDWEIAGARAYTASSLRSILDSQGRQEDWWLGQAVAGLGQSPEELAQAVERVSVEDAVEAAKALSLDTVYFLKGKEG